MPRDMWVVQVLNKDCGKRIIEDYYKTRIANILEIKQAWLVVMASGFHNAN